MHINLVSDGRSCKDRKKKRGRSLVKREQCMPCWPDSVKSRKMSKPTPSAARKGLLLPGQGLCLGPSIGPFIREGPPQPAILTHTEVGTRHNKKENTTVCRLLTLPVPIFVRSRAQIHESMQHTRHILVGSNTGTVGIQGGEVDENTSQCCLDPAWMTGGEEERYHVGQSGSVSGLSLMT